MQEKERFIKMWEGGSYCFNSLCESFGISRTAGYNLVNQYEKHGEAVFSGRPKVPLSTSHRRPPEIENAIVKPRQGHKGWGAGKIKKLLEKEFSKKETPSETTVNAILKRNNLIAKKRRRPAKEGRHNPRFDPADCDEIWSADYKGRFKTGDGRYCRPLTVRDSRSRKTLGVSCHYKAAYSSVKQSYINIFREHGLPEHMHTDNGSPFGSIQAVGRYSKLCYRLIDQGIQPVFSGPGCPQQNGRHGRMHRDLKDYVKPRIQDTLSRQQRVVDRFRSEYNEVRPHEALDMSTPDQVHIRSEREYDEKRKVYEYPIEFKVLKVTKNGSVRWGAYNWVYISRAAIGRHVGMEEIGNGIWNAYYRNVLLGCFDEKLLTDKEQYLRLFKIKV